MILKDVGQNALQSMRTKIAYRGSIVSFGARVLGQSSLGRNSKLGRNSVILDSHLGEGVTISSSCSIQNSSLEENAFVYPGCSLANVQLGKFSYVGFNSVVTRTKVGRFCSTGAYLLCGIGMHPADFISTSPVFYSTLGQCGTTFSDRDYFLEREEIVIGHDVWIGARVFIRDGVRIGHGAVVAAGAVVADDVPDYGIVGGVPAKLIRFRFPDRAISELLEIQWWNWTTEKLRQAQGLFAQADIDLFLKWASSHEGTQ